jgi:hypothetical protein
MMNTHACHKTEQWKLHGNISWNGYGNAMIGRQGGCFEEDIRRLMCDRAYHITGFGCTSKICTDSRGEKGQCTVPKRLAVRTESISSRGGVNGRFKNSSECVEPNPNTAAEKIR